MLAIKRERFCFWHFIHTFAPYTKLYNMWVCKVGRKLTKHHKIKLDFLKFSWNFPHKLFSSFILFGQLIKQIKKRNQRFFNWISCQEKKTYWIWYFWKSDFGFNSNLNSNTTNENLSNLIVGKFFQAKICFS